VAAADTVAAMGIPLDVDAVVFDCDGLLADTETCWTRAETTIFAEHGHPFGVEQKRLVIGRTLDGAAEAIAGYFGAPGSVPSIARRLRERVAAELSAGAGAVPGAVELVTAVRRRVPVAVASNSSRVFVELALRSAGLAGVFEHVYSADDVADPKPAPDLYLAACAGLGARPERSVAFEDSATGVASAVAAGLHVVGVPSLPGTVLDVHTTLSALTDDAVTHWALAVTPRSRATA
jgi:HAD superfamily hydrolase (TIGR01509 family)